MNATICFVSKDDIQTVCESYNIFLKPVCKVHITVQISGLSFTGAQTKCLSTWEVAEKLRQLCPSLLSSPTQFKVIGATVESVRFVVELETKADVKRVIKAVDSQRIKLSGFPQALRVRAGEAPVECPRKHDWDAFFRDAQDMNELLPGERPDTVIITNLPIRWFANRDGPSKLLPCPAVVRSVFETYGQVRRVDLPMLDPCQNPQLLPKLGISVEIANAYLYEFNRALIEGQGDNSSSESHTGFGKITPSVIKPLVLNGTNQTQVTSTTLTFTAYIQYIDYAGFAAAMEALRGKKLVHIPPHKEGDDASSLFSANIGIDFDRTKHLSDREIRRRRGARQHLEMAAAREHEKREAAKARRLRAEEEAIALAKAQAAAKLAEKEARKLARREKKRLEAEDLYARKRDALIQRKLNLENRRALLANRRSTAIRIISAVLRLASKRLQEEENWAAKVDRAHELVRANSVACQVSLDNKKMVDGRSSDTPVIKTMDAAKLRRSLLEKREMQLRQQLLMRRQTSETRSN